MDLGLSGLFLWLMVLYVSITVHEFMHAWTANYLGDPTAKAMGRVSLNPIAHIDPFGTVLLPLLLLISSGGAFAFGYAKPVQINPLNFKNHRLGEALTSVAGPAGNLFLMLVFAALYKLLPNQNLLFSSLMLMFVQLNAVLMVFNLLPIPPLDGSKVLYSFFPNSKLIGIFESYGPFILIPLVLLFGSYIIRPIVNLIFALLGI